MISYIPVLTTLLSVFFLSRIVPHYLSKRSPYLLWWTLGVLTFGLGTLTESINAIFGWSEWNTKIWYIVGALLGGYPLAQGTIYLLMNKRRCRCLRIALADCDSRGLRSPPHGESVCLAMGQGVFSLAQPLRLYFSFWRCCLLGHPIFREG